MNREQRRLVEREERRTKKQGDGGRGAAGRASAAAATRPEERQPFWKRIGTFLHEVRVELKKVSWPTREQMIAFTAVTVITSAALTLIVFVLDIGLKEVVLQLIGGGSG